MNSGGAESQSLMAVVAARGLEICLYRAKVKESDRK